MAAAVALYVGMGSAGAAVYNGTFDPTDFRGTFSFSVNDGCLNSSAPCTGSIFALTVDLLTGTSVTTLNFIPPLTAVAPSQFFVSGGEVIGLTTGLIGFRLDGSTPYWVQFGFGPSNVSNFALASVSAPFVDLFTGTCTSGGDSYSAPKNGGYHQQTCTPFNNPLFTANTVTFTRVVPEPGTLALLLIALAGGWLGLRRRGAA